MAIGTAFTLFVVSAIYTLLARRHWEEAEEERSPGSEPQPVQA